MKCFYPKIYTHSTSVGDVVHYKEKEVYTKIITLEQLNKQVYSDNKVSEEYLNGCNNMLQALINLGLIEAFEND